MADVKCDIVMGALLHDIGKVVFRSGDHRAHSISGRDLLAEIGLSSPAYITYIADNISAGSDRRNLGNEGKDNGFEPMLPLGSVFNILNHNDEALNYAAGTLEHKSGINFPSVDANGYNASYYNGILQ